MAKRKAKKTTLTQLLGLFERNRPRKDRLSPSFWKSQFDAVVDILDDMGWEVEMERGAADRALMGSNVIEINGACSPERRFYTLLHEVGHIVLREDWGRFTKMHPNYMDAKFAAPDGRTLRRTTYRIATLSEEFEAWRVGLDFALEKRLYVDLYKYEEESSKALLTYVNWVAEDTRTRAAAAQKARRTRRKTRR